MSTMTAEVPTLDRRDSLADRARGLAARAAGRAGILDRDETCSATIWVI